MRLVRAIILFALVALWGSPADSASSINVTQPPNGTQYSPAPIRNNFQAAANDINALQSCNAGPNPPSNPPVGACWWQTSLNAVYILWTWDGRAWNQIGSEDTTNHVWMPPVGGGVLPNLISGNLTDLGSFPQAAINVTGSNQITNLGSTAPPGAIKVMVFAGTPTLINGSALQIPSGTNVAQQAGDIAIALNFGGGNWKILYDSQVGPTLPSVRTALSGNLNMYVNPSIGNDTNTCILPGAPCQTIQRAINVLATTYDLKGFTATINLASGTYNVGALVQGLMVGQLNPTNLVIMGNASNPDSVVIVDTRSNPKNLFSGVGTPILVTNGGGLTVIGIKLVAGFRDMWGDSGASIYFQNIDFGSASECQIATGTGTSIRVTGNYTISAGAIAHYCAFSGATVYATDPNNQTLTNVVTILNSPSYSSAFAIASESGQLIAQSQLVSYSGAVVGVRYIANLNGVINTNNSGATFFPGTLPGIIQSGGQYDNLIAERTRLTQNTPFYVAAAGTDTNNSCLIQATPCATMQYAYNNLQNNYDLSGYIATIQLADGTYNQALADTQQLVGQSGAGQLILQGDVANKDLVVLTGSFLVPPGSGAGGTVNAVNTGNLTVQYVKIANSLGNDIFAYRGGFVQYNNIDFGATPVGCDAAANQGGEIYALSDQNNPAFGTNTISGNALGYVCTIASGQAYPGGVGATTNITFVGTPTLSGGFASASFNSSIFADTMVFNGTFVGPRFAVATQSIIDSGVGLNYFPGTTAGTADGSSCGSWPCLGSIGSIYH
jgi:hypothetical protein